MGTAQFILLSHDVDAPYCGRDCDCCEYDDGTAPIDHAMDCGVRGEDAVCDCGDSAGRARDRKRVRLRVGSQAECPHGRWR